MLGLVSGVGLGLVLGFGAVLGDTVKPRAELLADLAQAVSWADLWTHTHHTYLYTAALRRYAYLLNPSIRFLSFPCNTRYTGTVC